MTTLAALSADNLRAILAQLDTDDLLTARLVCKAFRNESDPPRDTRRSAFLRTAALAAYAWAELPGYVLPETRILWDRLNARPSSKRNRIDLSAAGGYSRMTSLSLLQGLHQVPGLRTLNLKFYFGHLSADRAAALGKMLERHRSLTTLHLGGNGMGDKGTCALVESLTQTSLTSLDLGGNNVGDDGVFGVARWLEHNRSLSHLDLECNSLSASSVVALAKCLQEHNDTLTSLSLSSNRVCRDGAAALAECLQRNTSLTSLNLSASVIGPKGSAVLAACLRINSTLTRLDLSDNPFGDESASALAPGLANNTALTSLSLSSNEIDTQGANALCACLTTHPTLTSLDLSFNRGLRDEGAAALARGLASNTVLTHLSLSQNNFRTEGANALCECLRTNSTLTNLNLSRCNCLDDADIENLLAAWGGRGGKLNTERRAYDSQDVDAVSDDEESEYAIERSYDMANE